MTAPLDLDEIARLETWIDPPNHLYVKITPAERDALVAAARREAAHRVVRPQGLDIDELERCVGGEDPPDDIVLSLAEMRLLLRRARVPEMPADVAGMVKRLFAVAIQRAEACHGLPHNELTWQAATLIESLERQRQEQEARHAKTEKDACMWAERAEQADKELDNWKVRAHDAESRLDHRDATISELKSRFAKLEEAKNAVATLGHETHDKLVAMRDLLQRYMKAVRYCEGTDCVEAMRDWDDFTPEEHAELKRMSEDNQKDPLL